MKDTGWALEFASEKFKDDKEIVLEALRNYGKVNGKLNGNALEHASERLRDDREVVLEALGNSGHALKFASERFKDEREIVLEAVKDTGWALQFASDRFHEDKEIVLEAVKNEGKVLKYASTILQSSLDLRLVASTTSSPELLEDVMSFASKTMENGNSEEKEYLDVDISDALSFFAKKHPSMFDKAEEIVAFIHDPKRSLFQTHTKRKFEQSFCVV